MIRILSILVVTALIILGIPYILPGFSVDSFMTALLVASLIGLINITLRPLIILFTLPMTILTFGIFVFFINAFLLWLVAYLIKGFEVEGFFSAFLGALLISLGRMAVDKILPKE